MNENGELEKGENPSADIEGCPYLEVNEKEVLCRASDWGKSEKVTGEIQRHFGSLPQAMTVHCSSPKHAACSMFKKEKMWGR